MRRGIDVRSPPTSIERLQQLPDFVRAYEPDGMTPVRVHRLRPDAADARASSARVGWKVVGELYPARWRQPVEVPAARQHRRRVHHHPMGQARRATSVVRRRSGRGNRDRQDDVRNHRAGRRHRARDVLRGRRARPGLHQLCVSSATLGKASRRSGPARDGGRDRHATTGVNERSTAGVPSWLCAACGPAVAAASWSPRATRFARRARFPSGRRSTGLGTRRPRCSKHDVRQRVSRRRRPDAGARAALTGPRATIARRMRESLASTAQYTLHASADATRPARAARAPSRRVREGWPDITINDLVAFCTIQALRRHAGAQRRVHRWRDRHARRRPSRIRRATRREDCSCRSFATRSTLAIGDAGAAHESAGRTGGRRNDSARRSVRGDVHHQQPRRASASSRSRRSSTRRRWRSSASARSS